MEGQDKFIMREFDDAEVGLREDCGEDLLDVGSNVDLYVANQIQETVDSIYEVHVAGDALRLPSMGLVKISISFVRLVLTKCIRIRIGVCSSSSNSN